MLSDARRAATVIVVRDGPERPDGTLEVLLLQRSDVGAFAGFWVFPGGRVDDTDAGDDDVERARSAAAREAAEEVGLAIDRSALVTWAHWAPPPVQPKRFLTWFFVAGWDGSPVVVDGHEIVGHEWVVPTDGIARALTMAPPTIVSLHQLSAYRSVADVLAVGPPRGVEQFTTRLGKLDGALVAMWHGDAGYETGDAAAPEPHHRLIVRPGVPQQYVRTA